MTAEWLLRKIPKDRKIRVRYEDLVSRPEKTIRKIGGKMGFDLESQAIAAGAGKEFKVGHNIAGNRLRMNGKIRIEPAKGMKWKLSFWHRLVVRIFAWPLMLRYHYR